MTKHVHTQYTRTQLLPSSNSFPEGCSVSQAEMPRVLSPWPASGPCLLFHSVLNRPLSLWDTALSSSLSFFKLLQLRDLQGLEERPLLLCTTVHSYACMCILMPRCSLSDLKELGFYVFQLGGHLRAAGNICGAANQIMSRALYYSCLLAPKRAEFH